MWDNKNIEVGKLLLELEFCGSRGYSLGEDCYYTVT